MVPLWAALIEMFLALHVHQVEFVNQSMPLQKSERAIDRDAVDLRVKPAGVPQQLTGIQMLFGRFHHAEDGSALTGHAQTARHQFRL